MFMSVVTFGDVRSTVHEIVSAGRNLSNLSMLYEHLNAQLRMLESKGGADVEAIYSFLASHRQLKQDLLSQINLHRPGHRSMLLQGPGMLHSIVNVRERSSLYYMVEDRQTRATLTDFLGNVTADLSFHEVLEATMYQLSSSIDRKIANDAYAYSEQIFKGREADLPPDWRDRWPLRLYFVYGALSYYMARPEMFQRADSHKRPPSELLYDLDRPEVQDVDGEADPSNLPFTGLSKVLQRAVDLPSILKGELAKVPGHYDPDIVTDIGNANMLTLNAISLLTPIVFHHHFLEEFYARLRGFVRPVPKRVNVFNCGRCY